jgi:hypothetical protein
MVSDTTYNGQRLIVSANVGARHLAGHKQFGIKVGVAIPAQRAPPRWDAI